MWDSSLIDEILKLTDPSGGQFSLSSPLATNATQIESTPPAASQPSENGESKLQMQDLTEQMELLSSNAKKGFKRADPHLLEFTNEGFVKGQRHLLSSIERRESNHRRNQQPHHAIKRAQQLRHLLKVVKPVVEEDIEGLDRDFNNVLKQEVVVLNKKAHTTVTQLESITQRLTGIEQRDQGIMSFLKAVNPDYEPGIDSFSPGSDLIWGSSSMRG
ncbi:heat shock factor protein HSF8-like [Daucus carota subsp. sativus]|uniref:heat shock factor protein HSF8-like n=1 Tax=Daucus carota subsp. sativus TaxID=79200 RepID=UPI003082B3B5